MGEFSHHPGANPDGCCLFTLLMLLTSASLVVGGFAWLLSAIS